MGKSNDILTSAGLDVEAFGQGVDKMLSGMDKIEAQGKKTAGGIEQVSKAAKDLRNIAVAEKIVAGLDLIAAGGGRATAALNATNQNASLNNFSAGAENIVNYNAALGTAIDFTSQLSGRVGVYAKVATVAADAINDAAQANYNFSKSSKVAAFTTEGVIRKESELTAMQTKEQSGMVKNQGMLESMASQRDRNAKKYKQHVEDELKAADGLSSGAEQRLALLDIETQKRQKLEDVKSELLKNTVSGDLSPSSKEILKSATKEIELQAKLQERGLKTTLAETSAQIGLNRAGAAMGVTLLDQLNYEDAIQASIKEQLASAQQLYKADSLIVTSLQAQLKAAENRKDTMEYLKQQSLQVARNAVEAKDAELAGNEKLANLTKIRLQYEQQIADAKRAGRNDIVEELRKSQALAELSAKALDFRKTPQQRAEERKEQVAQDQAIRTVNAREKDAMGRAARGAYAKADSNEHVSKATQRARDEYAARHSKDIKPAQQQKDAVINRMIVAQFDVQHLANK